ncbi:MAG: hypothetical protein QM723_12650 [Myxococcaceae bacterium]
MERPWEVTPMDPLVQHEDNLWSIGGELPWMRGMNRRMAIARTADGRLVFYNAIPLEDALVEKLRAWGKPWLLVVPHHQHMRYGHAFAQKLGLETCAPDGELAKVAARIPGTLPFSKVQLDDTLRLGVFESSKLHEGYLLVKSGPRTSVAVSDVVMNLNDTTLKFKLLGFGGGPKIVFFAKVAFIKDGKLLKQELRQIAQEPGMSRVIVSHGDVIETGGREVLEQVAR